MIFPLLSCARVASAWCFQSEATRCLSPSGFQFVWLFDLPSFQPGLSAERMERRSACALRPESGHNHGMARKIIPARVVHAAITACLSGVFVKIHSFVAQDRRPSGLPASISLNRSAPQRLRARHPRLLPTASAISNGTRQRPLRVPAPPAIHLRYAFSDWENPPVVTLLCNSQSLAKFPSCAASPPFPRRGRLASAALNRQFRYYSAGAGLASRDCDSFLRRKPDRNPRIEERRDRDKRTVCGGSRFSAKNEKRHSDLEWRLSLAPELYFPKPLRLLSFQPSCRCAFTHLLQEACIGRRYGVCAHASSSLALWI